MTSSPIYQYNNLHAEEGREGNQQHLQTSSPKMFFFFLFETTSQLVTGQLRNYAIRNTKTKKQQKKGKGVISSVSSFQFSGGGKFSLSPLHGGSQIGIKCLHKLHLDLTGGEDWGGRLVVG